jgi:hypothetical protein
LINSAGIYIRSLVDHAESKRPSAVPALTTGAGRGHAFAGDQIRRAASA